MILIGIGSNLSSEFGDPRETCEAALCAMNETGIAVRMVSRWYRTQPQPVSDQPWFVNGVASVTTSLAAGSLLGRLHAIEEAFGRVRSVANAARPLDLDLLAYGDEIHDGALTVPHPRLQERAFVLFPLADLAPGWLHPILGKTAVELRMGLSADQGIEPAPVYGP